MQHIEIAHPSIGQIRKMRKGLSVRIKQGTGFNLIVHPHTYNQVSKTFAKNKGIELALSSEELQANAEEASSMEGGSIFGKKFDNKHPSLMKPLYAIGSVVKPYAQEALKQGIDMGATALKTYAPELSPFIDVGARKLNNAGQSYINDPDATYRKARNTINTVKGMNNNSNAGGSSSMPDMSMYAKMAKAEGNRRLNEYAGTNYDYMSRAGLENAGTNALKSKLDSSAFAQKYAAPVMGEEAISDTLDGTGFRRSMGYGFGGFRREVGSIGRGSGMISRGMYLPPAMMSQPSGANFQMQHFLPPQYQQYWSPAVEHSYSGYGLGAGLGGGLYA